MKGEPFRDRAGVPVRVAGTAMDVTDRKRVEDERRRVEARLQVSERLASVGTLAAGVAHEINNPLCFILANLQYLAEHVAGASRDAPVPSELEAAVAESLAGAARIRSIVSDLRQYADGRAARPGPVDVGEVIDFCLRIADARVRERARLRREIAPLPPVQGDRAQLGQVILNLLVNAADAIAPGHGDENEITVRARHDAEGSRVVVDVSDTGAGISPAEAAHVFDPFYTTKPVGLGTGLGLFVCHGLVRGMGGEISLEPGPGGRGTTFRVSLVTEDPRSRAA
jgi:signal transduction histidine kinase